MKKLFPVKHIFLLMLILAVSAVPVFAASQQTSSTDAPSNSYDVTILDANSVDILAGAGADCGVLISDIDRRIPQKITLMDETLTPVVANAGNTKAGAIELFLETR